MSVVSTVSGEKKLIKIDEDGTDTYIGFAQLGSSAGNTVWQILRISESGTEITIAYADGNSNYDNEWDERTTYTYS